MALHCRPRVVDFAVLFVDPREDGAAELVREGLAALFPRGGDRGSDGAGRGEDGGPAVRSVCVLLNFRDAWPPGREARPAAARGAPRGSGGGDVGWQRGAGRSGE